MVALTSLYIDISSSNLFHVFPVPGRPTIVITVGQGPIALAIGAGVGGLDIFTLICPFSSFFLSLEDGPI